VGTTLYRTEQLIENISPIFLKREISFKRSVVVLIRNVESRESFVYFSKANAVIILPPPILFRYNQQQPGLPSKYLS